jgi:hypothetical protein
LLALTFIQNPDPEHLKIVDHKNGKKWDNDLKNLRWVTAKESAQNRKRKKTTRIVEQDEKGFDGFVIPKSYLKKRDIYNSS